MTMFSTLHTLRALVFVAASSATWATAQAPSQVSPAILLPAASQGPETDGIRAQIELPPPKPAASAQPGASNRSAYVIGPDDQIVVRVADNPELSDKPQKVDLNGELWLPMIGRLQAAGLTPKQLEAALTARYKVFLNEPDVMVAVLESHSQPVSIVGAVGQPGVKQIDGRKTLGEMLLMAGGASADAGPLVTLTRRVDRGRIPLPNAKDDPSGQFSTAEIELRPLLEGRAPTTDVVLQPNDVISVSKAQVVFVIGEVGRAGPQTLQKGNSMSVLEAVSAAGGVLKTAAPGNARILRPVAGTETRTELPIDISKILAGKSSDVALLGGDILIVPDSKGKRAAARALEIAITTGVAVGTYGLIR